MGSRNTTQPETAKESESQRKVNSENNVLESKTFKDGAIYLYIRADYKKPIWMCRVKKPKLPGYINRSTRSTDEHEAFKFAANLYEQEWVKTLGKAEQSGRRIGKAIDGYVEHFEKQRNRVSIHYKLLLIERCRSFLEKKTFDNLDTRMISDLTATLAKTSNKGSLSANTIKRHYSDLKHFFNWCMEQGHLNQIPRFPKISSEASRRPHFDLNDWRTLVRHLREFVKVKNRKTFRDRSMLVNYVLILGNTGIRVGEARGIKWRDVRPVDGKQEGVTNLVLNVQGKTGQREVVASSGDVKKYFKRIFDLRKAELGALEGSETKPGVDSLVFCHSDGTEIKSFKKSFSTLLKSAGVETDTFGNKRTIYSLRHTYATFRLLEGVNHYALAQNMGTSVAMLEKHYGHTTNISAADELTKRKPRQPNRNKHSKSGKTSAFGWLNE